MLFCRLHDTLLTIGFTESRLDQSLFIYSDSKVTTYFLVYVDKIVLSALSDEFISTIITKLSTEFALKDIGPLSFFLGIQLTRMDNRDIVISQE